MPTVMVADFSGMLPLRDPILLPDNNSQYALNTWLYQGKVRGFRHGTPVYTLKYNDTKLVYRIPITNVNPPDFTSPASFWLEYPDPFMATIRNPTVGDQWDRYYFFPSDQINAVDNTHWRGGPQYATLAMLQNGDPPWILGIPPPSTAATVSPPPLEIITTATAPTLPGDQTTQGSPILTVADTTGVTVGMLVSDATDTQVQAYSNADTPIGTNFIPFADTTGIIVGMSVQDLYNPAAIFFGTSVNYVDTTNSRVGLTTLTTVDIPTDELIEFHNVNQIPLNTTVKSVDSATQVTMSANAVMGGVQTGDTIQFATDVPETRAYVYTWVTAYAEEGPPSPVTVSTGDPAGPWTIQVPPLEAAIAQDRNIQGFRLYRTVTDSQGNAAYYQVNPDIYWTPSDPANLAGVTIVDSNKDTDITGNKPLDSVSYTPPPADLQGVVMMANGIAVGWSNQREVWFSAAYLPHAWPAVYALTVDYPIVGLTADGSSLNVVTEGSPFIATGVTPDTMTMGKVTANEPCIGRGSVIATGEGAYYASPNGYQLLNSSGTTNITLELFEKEFWWKLQPYSFVGGKYGMSTVIFNKGGSGSEIDGAVFDFSNKNTPFAYINVTGTIINAMTDERSGQVFYLADINSVGQVIQWNPPIGTPGSTTLWNYVWRTKRFRFTSPQELKAFTVYFEVPPEVTFTPGVRNTDQTQSYNESTQYIIVRVYADGKQVVVREVQHSGETLLITGGFKATYWEFQFEGIVDFFFFKAASSVKELKTG